MADRGKYTDKDEIIDMIITDSFNDECFDDDTYDRLRRMTAADLFLLQKLFSQSFEHGRKKERGDDE